jgi:hypothetical protein
VRKSIRATLLAPLRLVTRGAASSSLSLVVRVTNADVAVSAQVQTTGKKAPDMAGIEKLRQHE